MKNKRKEQRVKVAKTDNGNYVVFLKRPRRALVVLGDSGKVIQKNDAEFGQALWLYTKQTKLQRFAEAIEEYEQIIANWARKEKEAEQQAINELYDTNEGWYIVELPCCQDDLRRGGFKKRYTNWKVLAKSKLEAYYKAVKMAEKKNLHSFENPEKCNIDFYGVWTDEKEDLIREMGL